MPDNNYKFDITGDAAFVIHLDGWGHPLMNGNEARHVDDFIADGVPHLLLPI